MLSTATTAATTHAVRSMERDGSAELAAASARLVRYFGNNLDQKRSSKQARAGRMVSQFRKERLPLSAMTIWNAIITTPLMFRAIPGQKTNHGAISSAR